MSGARKSSRISGWIPIMHQNRMGGLVDISLSGGRVYLMWKTKPGDCIPLVLRGLGRLKTMTFSLRIVWVKKDEPGNLAGFEARIKLLQDMVRAGRQCNGMPHGYLCGVAFDGFVDRESVRFVQKHFEQEKGRVVTSVMLSSG